MCVQLHPQMGCPLGRRGGRGQIPTSPSFSPAFWVSGRGFRADLALWCPFAEVGVVLDPHPVLLRGGGQGWGAGIQKSVFLHPFPPVLLEFFFPRV